MKYLLCAFFVFACANSEKIILSQPQQDLLYTVRDLCIKDSGATKDDLAKFNKNGSTDNKAVKCFMKCLFLEYTAMDEAGNLDTAPFSAVFPEKYVNTIIKGVTKCFNSASGNDLCEKAYSASICLFKLDSDNFVLPE